MKRILLTTLLVATSLAASAQVQIDKQVQMTGAAANDRRITNVSNAADVTPVGTDAININTVQRNYVNYSVGTFGGGTYAVTLTPAPAAYAAGMRITFRATAANTGATNINVNALGAIPLVKPNGGALAANEILAGQIVEAVYDGTSGHFEMVSPSSANAWMTLGNAGTVAGTNFLGTTDDVSLDFRTNNAVRATLMNTGQFRFNTDGTEALPVLSWTASTGLGLYRIGANDMGISTSGLQRMRFFPAGNVFVNNNSLDIAGAGQVVLGARSINDDISVHGINTGTGFGVIGEAPNGGMGVYGYKTLTTGAAIVGWTNRTVGQAGSGVAGLGHNVGTYYELSGTPTGGAFTGIKYGTFSSQTETGLADHGAYIGNYYQGATQRTVYVGAMNGGTHYKILGTGGGSVSTTMETRDGERILFAPEATENWFFDMGEVQLVNGKAIVQLDPIFADCISDKKPFKVFVQGAEDTYGQIRVTRSQSEKSFILEDLGGASNGTVQFSVYGIWKGKEDVRLPKFENNIRVVEHTLPSPVSTGKDVKN
jgi:hypothetical protein